jgi:hypothetical protein
MICFSDRRSPQAAGIDGGAVVEIAEALQKGFAIQSRQFGPIRFLDEEVEVVGHHHISDDTETEKSLEHAHEVDKISRN